MNKTDLIKEIEIRIGYAIEDERLDPDQAEKMTYSEKVRWLSLYDQDYDPY
jgi:hypothetical protein